MKPRKHIITIVDGEETGQAKVDERASFDDLDWYAQEALIELIASIIENKRDQA